MNRADRSTAWSNGPLVMNDYNDRAPGIESDRLRRRPTPLPSVGRRRITKGIGTILGLPIKAHSEKRFKSMDSKIHIYSIIGHGYANTITPILRSQLIPTIMKNLIFPQHVFFCSWKLCFFSRCHNDKTNLSEYALYKWHHPEGTFLTTRPIWSSLARAIRTVSSQNSKAKGIPRH